MVNPATDATSAILTVLQSVAGLEQKSFFILSEDELMNRAVTVSFPAAGVIYEGMRSNPDQGATHHVGLNATINVAIIVFYKNAVGIGVNAADSFKPQALALLDTIRNLLRDTRGPSGHYWHFLMEAPALEKNGVVVWVQRWSLPIKLSPAVSPT